MEYKYTGIILNKKDISETDRLYNIYTLEQGKVSVIARGVRKPHAKLAGHLENFYLIDLTVMKNRGMGNIASSIVENNFKKIHNDFDSLEKVFKAIRVFTKLIGDEEKDAVVFSLLLNYLETMDDCRGTDDREEIIKKDLITQGFIFKLLDTLGYKIETGKCVGCEGKLSERGNLFDCSRGGVVCKNCAKESSNAWPISNNSIKIIRIFFQNKLNALTKLKITQREATELNRMSQIFVKWIC